MRPRLKLRRARTILAVMWAAILRRVTVVLTVFALLGAVPAMAAPFAPLGMPDCGALMGETAMGGVPCDPGTPKQGQPACSAAAIGCTAAALPSPVAQAPFVLSPPRIWIPVAHSVLLGRTIEPHLFPPIRSV